MLLVLKENSILNEADIKPPKRKYQIEEPDNPPDFTDPNNQQQQQDPNTNDDTNQQPAQDTQIPQTQYDQNTSTGEEQDQEGDQIDPNQQQDPSIEQPELESPIQQEDPLKGMEQEVFADLTPQQIAIKTKELKNSYKSLSDFISSSIEKLNQASRTSYDANLLDFLMRKLISLKELTNTTIIDTFDTRTYLANKIELHRLVTAMNMISNLLNEVLEARIKRLLKYEKQNKKGKSSPVEFTKDINSQ